MSEQLSKVAVDELGEAQTWPGVTRQEAFATQSMWSGMAHTYPGAVSGWHHHGGYERSLHFVSGTFRLEFGPGGQQVAEARAGDFVYVPRGVVHRESNPYDDAVIMVMTRAGHGPAVIEAGGPDPHSRGAQPPG